MLGLFFVLILFQSYFFQYLYRFYFIGINPLPAFFQYFFCCI